MKKLSLLAVALLCNYASANEAKKDDSVEINLISTMRTDKSMEQDILKEVQKDAEALTKKYEEVCGVEVSVEQNKSEISTEQTKRCKCKCRCSSCTSGSCSSCSSCSCCRSMEQAVCADCGESTAADATVRCSCNKPKAMDDEYCACELVQTKCPDCGKLVEDIQCACGKPNPRDLEIDRCACGKPKPTTAEEN